MPNANAWRRLMLAAAGLAAVEAGCQLEPPDPLLFGDLQIVPILASQHVAVPLPIDGARVRVERAVRETVLDTLVPFPPQASAVTIRLRVGLKASSERLAVTVELVGGNQVYFTGSGQVDVAAGPGPPATPQITLTYVGPGANIRTLRIMPRDSLLAFSDALTLRLDARDAQGAPVTGFPVEWSSDDPQLSVSTGVVIAPARRVTVRIRAEIPNGIKDSTSLRFIPVPAALLLISGAGQTGQGASTLPIPFAVEVRAADQLPVAGVTVRFRALSTAASVRDSVVVTGANGQAATIMLLGRTATGVISFEASVPKVAPVVITAVAQ